MVKKQAKTKKSTSVVPAIASVAKPQIAIILGLLNGIRNRRLKDVLITLFFITTVVLPALKGIYEVGVENRVWGDGEGELEKHNLTKMKEHWGKVPMRSVIVIDTEQDRMLANIYEGGDVAVIRIVKDAAGKQSQQIIWVSKDNPLKPQEKAELSLIRSALAADVVTAADAPAEFKDEVLEWIDNYTAKIKRVYPDGCYEILLLDGITGAITEIIQAKTCP